MIRALLLHTYEKFALSTELTALNICVPFLPANGASKNLLPQTAMGGICTANSSQPAADGGTLAHSWPLITVSSLLDITFDPVY